MQISIAHSGPMAISYRQHSLSSFLLKAVNRQKLQNNKAH